jgi:hypothetical protein
MTVEPALYPMPPRDLMPRRTCGRRTRSGGTCTQWAMRGQTVCKMHGGKSPQALRTAAERLAALVDPALAELGKLVEDAENDAIKLAAIKDVLDRAGFKPRERIEQSGKVTVEVVYGDGES